jgi:Tfp pilus assembly protein PilF
MKPISGLVGAVLLVAAIILSYVSTHHAGAMLAKQNALVTKYVNVSKNSLANGDIATAIKNAKMAIQANPENNAGYKSYENALKAKYQPTGSAAPAQAAPAPSSSDSSDDSMGC